MNLKMSNPTKNQRKDSIIINTEILQNDKVSI